MMGFLRGVARTLWWLFVAAVLGAALLLTGARLLITTVGDYQEQASAWAEEQLGLGISVGSVDTGMHGLHFALVLGDVVVTNADGEPTAGFEELRLSLAGLASLRARDFVFGELVLVGADLLVVHDAEGRLRIGGLEQAEPHSTGASGERLRSWLFNQQRLVLRDVRLHWQDALRGEGHPRHLSTVDEARLVNHQRGHQLEADLVPAAAMGGTLAVRAYFEGAGSDPRDWRGTLYSRGRGVELGGLEELGVAVPVLATGQLDWEIWSDWERGQLEGGQGSLSLSDVTPQGSSPRFAGLNGIEADLVLAGGRDQWQVDLPWLRFHGDDQWRAPTAARLALHTDGPGGRLSLAARLGEIALADVTPWLDYIPAVEESLNLRRLRAARFRGLLAELAVDLHPGARPGARWVAHARGEGLAWDAVEKFPGARGLDGRVWLDPQGGLADIEMAEGEVSFPELAREPWPVARAGGRLDWIRGGLAGRDGLYLRGHELRVANEDLAAHGRLAIHHPGVQGERSFLDLMVGLERGNAVATPRYLPVAHMPPQVVAWLDQAIQGGRVERGHVLIHGRVDEGEFPWPQQRRGRLEIAATIADGGLSYDPQWPELDAIAGELRFVGERMEVHAEGGRYREAVIGPTRVTINSLRAVEVELHGSAAGDAGDFAEFVRGMPLEDPVAGHLAYLDGEGPLDLELDLSLPIGQVEGRPRFTGTLRANGDAALGYRRWGHDLWWHELVGTVTFTEDGYRADGLRGTLLGGAVTAEVDGTREADGMGARIRANGILDADGLGRFLPPGLAAGLDGTTPWHLALDQTPGRGIEARLDTALEGLGMALPHPLNKAVDVRRPTRVVWRGAGREFSLQHGDALAARGRWDGTMSEIAVHLGDGRPALTAEPGIRVTGELVGLEPAAWRGMLPDGGDEAAEDWQPFWSNWELPPISVELKRLHLTPPERDADAPVAPPGPLSPLRPGDLPPFTLAIGELRHGDARLGQLEAEGRHGGGDLYIPLTLGDGNFRLTGRLDWRGALGRTDARLTLAADDTGRLLRRLGLNPFMQDGRLESEWELFWTGSPGDFHLIRLSGGGEFSVINGRLLEVEPGAGRALGLFSLRALPRRIGLDFSDLFGRGLGFDRLAGELTFGSGDAHIADFRLDSSVARVMMRGRTGLVERDLDQQIIVIPGDGSHFFLPGALIWGPQTGALIWLAERVLQLDEVARYNYRVTGSWVDPKVENIGTQRSGSSD